MKNNKHCSPPFALPDRDDPRKPPSVSEWASSHPLEHKVHKNRCFESPLAHHPFSSGAAPEEKAVCYCPMVKAAVKRESACPTASGMPLVGMFDSGIGGFSVLRAWRGQLPGVPVLYVADQAHVPYGGRPREELYRLAAGITRFLLGRGARLVTVACNTASGAALHRLRAEFPGTPFVGMEPAVKPAAAATRSGVVGVLATPGTLTGELYAGVVQRFAHGQSLLEDACPGLVARIEAGDLDGPGTRAILERALRPMLARGMDALVLGCTHYPLVLPLIRELAGPGVEILDPAPAVARRAAWVLTEAGLLPAAPATATARAPLFLATTGDPDILAAQAARLLPGETPELLAIRWEADMLISFLPRQRSAASACSGRS